jgi:GNAT superfamily N-acetyltransferase
MINFLNVAYNLYLNLSGVAVFCGILERLLSLSLGMEFKYFTAFASHMLRKATIEDAGRCSELIQQVMRDSGFNETYPPAILAYWMNNTSPEGIEKAMQSRAEIICYEEKGMLLGTGALVNSRIEKVYVSKKSQHHGIGTAIMEELEKIAREKGSNQTELFSTPNAIKFYEKLGYVNHGQIEGDLGPSFFRMTKDLTRKA